ncbi:MAG: hypothetical protein ACWGN7_08050 [Thermodesulfovibrionales bacterium]
MEKFQDAMSAVTFAEAGEPETARSLLVGEPQEDGGIPGIDNLQRRCDAVGIRLRSYSIALSPVDAVREFLKLKKGIDMVLLSPGITSRGKVRARELTRLMRTASRPVVTMTRQPMPQTV